METKPNTFLVGVFVLSISIAGILFTLWFSQVNFKHTETIFQINFEGPVTGLRVNENVLYQGIPIGKVWKIKVDKEDVVSVKVLVAISRPYLIREDSIASIEAQGLTGNTFVQIRGSTKESPKLKKHGDQKYPIIRSRRSSIDALFLEAPIILEKMSKVVTKLDALLDEKMLNHTASIMQNFDHLITELSQGPQSLQHVLKALKHSLSSIDKTSHAIQEMVQENRPGLQGFTEAGLPALTRVSKELEQSVTQMGRIIREIEKSPIEFLHKNTNQGIKLDD